MATAGAEATGLKELRDAIEQLPADVTAALKAVARLSADRIKTHAQQILRSKLKTSAHALIDGIVVIEEDAKHQFVVDSTRPVDQPALVPYWTERGTRFQAARPYMRPAGDAEDEHYKNASLAAASSVADRLGTL